MAQTARRFFIDEDLLGVAKVWGINRDDCCWPGYGIDVAVGDPDTSWVPKVAESNLVAITKDKKLNSRPAEIEAIVHHRLRVVRLTVGRRPRTIQDLANRLDRRWANINAFVELRTRGPWLLSVTDNKVEEIAIAGRSAGWGDITSAADE